MSIKNILKRVQTAIPESWLFPWQSLHARLIYNWLINQGSKPLSVSSQPALIFSPHQDDETFGCGGIIALKRASGVRVGVVFLTDGGGSGGFAGQQRSKIVATRKQEASVALNILGVGSEDIYFLDRPDGELPTLTTDIQEATIREIINLIKQYQPQEIYVPHAKDCHRDHEATYTLVKTAIARVNLAIELWQYPIWAFWRAPLLIMLKLQDISNAHRVSIIPVQHQKNQAIAAYHSQLAALPPGFIDRFLGSNEIFFK